MDNTTIWKKLDNSKWKYRSEWFADNCLGRLEWMCTCTPRLRTACQLECLQKYLLQENWSQNWKKTACVPLDCTILGSAHHCCFGLIGRRAPVVVARPAETNSHCRFAAFARILCQLVHCFPLRAIWVHLVCLAVRYSFFSSFPTTLFLARELRTQYLS